MILLASVLLALLMGFAVQRGGTCLVAALEEVVHRRRWARFRALLETSLWVLGGFVLLTGLLLWAMARESNDRRTVLRIAKWGMIVVGLVMLGAGWSAGLALEYYVVDYLFCFAVAFVLHRWREN